MLIAVVRLAQSSGEAWVSQSVFCDLVVCMKKPRRGGAADVD